MPSQPFSASGPQNAGVTAASVPIISRTNLIGLWPSRNLRAVSRSNSCSSLKPMSMAFSRSCDRSVGHRAFDEAAMHDPPVFAAVGVEHGAMQQAAIVPHHEVAGAPAVAVHKPRLRRVFEEVAQQRRAFRRAQLADVHRAVAEL